MAAVQDVDAYLSGSEEMEGTKRAIVKAAQSVGPPIGAAAPAFFWPNGTPVNVTPTEQLPLQCVQQTQTSSSSKVSEPPDTLPIDMCGWLEPVTGPHVRASLMVDEGAPKRSW